MTDAISTLQDQTPTRSMRDRILDFEAAMARHPDAQYGNQERCPLTHTFAGPIYVRQILIPKGFLATGRIHRYEHPIFFMSGDASVFDEFSGPHRVKAPCHFISKPGTKRIVFAHENTIIVTVHHVAEERDIDKIEDMHMAWTYEEYEKGLPCPDQDELISI
jgi:hypothetical protein